MKIFSIQCSPTSDREFLFRKVYRVWSNGGMILTGETEALEEKYYTARVLDEWMNMEQC